MLLTVLSVALGTAFICGSLILTHSLSESFESIVDTGVDGIDVGLVGSAASPHGVPLDVVRQLEQRTDVRAVNVTGDGPGTPSGTRRAGQSALVITDREQRPLQAGSSGAHPLAAYPSGSWVSPEPVLRQGSWPVATNQIALNQSAARRGGINVGDVVTVVTQKAKLRVTVVGVYSTPVDTAGWIGVMFTPEQYLELFTDGESASQVVIAAADGVSPMELRNRLSRNYPTLTPLTAEQIAARMSNEYTRQLAFISYLLAAFGVIALIVGGFIISNTLLMLLHQRSREFALLRCVGVSTFMVRCSVLAEALLAGILGSLLGVASGTGVVGAVVTVLNVRGDELSNIHFVLTSQAATWPILCGVLITLLAALEPTRRVGLLSPVDALRTAATEHEPARWRMALGAILLTLGVAGTVAGAIVTAVNHIELNTEQRLALVGVSAVMTLFGVAVAGPLLARVLLPALSRSTSTGFGAIGVLARRNIVRNAHRTAATALALSLGVGLVACVGTIGASARSSVTGLVESGVKSDFVLDSIGGSSLPGSVQPQSGLAIPAEAVDALDQLPGVASEGVLMTAPLQVDGWDNPTTTVFSGQLTKYLDVRVVSGEADTMLLQTVMISSTYARQSGLQVGDYVTLRPYDATADTTIDIPIRAIYEETGLFGHIVVSAPAAKRVLPNSSAYLRKLVFVQGNGEQTMGELRQSLLDTVAQYLVIQVKTKQEFKGALGTQVNQMLQIVTGLLALAVLIAVLGIVNTLVLSIAERRREIGMLRAVGVSRRQISLMFYLESVAMSIYGALLGMCMGILWGWAIVRVLSTKGMGAATLPAVELLIMLIFAIGVGVAAAIVPSRRAAKTPPLVAIAQR